MTILYIVVVLIVIIAILAMIAPKTYHVERKILVKKPVQEVFNYVKFLKKHDDWSPWSKKDPDMKKEFTGSDGEVGFVSAWEGNRDVGTGEQEIKRIVDNQRLETELRFLKPFKSTSDAFINVKEAEGDSTEVTWGFSGKNKFPVSIMMMFMNMDKTVGKDFEEGLSNMKSQLEG